VTSAHGPGIGYMITTIVLDIVLGFVAAIIVAWFSRQREFRADAGAAQLMGRKQPMINALARLGGLDPGELPKSMAAMGIAGGIGKLFSTHPPIEERIAALQTSLRAAGRGVQHSRLDISKEIGHFPASNGRMLLLFLSMSWVGREATLRSGAPVQRATASPTLMPSTPVTGCRRRSWPLRPRGTGRGC
jgi:hypothetical protein